MKKFILMFALIIGAVVGVNAQTALQTQKLLDNTYVGASVGATTPMTFNSVFPLNTTASLTIGKNWSPIFGTEVQGGVIFNDNGFGVPNSYTFVKGVNTSVNTTINLTNLLFGFEPNKKFNVQTVTGLGWLHLYSSNAMFKDGTKVSKDDDELTAKTGLRFSYALDKTNKWSVNVEPSVLWNLTNGSKGLRDKDAIEFNKNHAQLALSVGLTYNFKTTNGTHDFKLLDVGKLNGEINSLRSQLNAKPKEVVREVVREKVVEKTVTQNTWVIFFDKGSFELSDEAKSVLNTITKGTVVDVVGHASADGSEQFNQTLSENRAKSVSDFLTTRGAIVNKSTGEGEVGTPKNRVVIVTSTR